MSVLSSLFFQSWPMFISTLPQPRPYILSLTISMDGIFLPSPKEGCNFCHMINTRDHSSQIYFSSPALQVCSISFKYSNSFKNKSQECLIVMCTDTGTMFFHTDQQWPPCPSLAGVASCYSELPFGFWYFQALNSMTGDVFVSVRATNQLFG